MLHSSQTEGMRPRPFSRWGMESVETALAPLIRNAEATLVELRCGAAVVPMIVPDLDVKVDPRERCSVTCMESAAIGYVLDEWRSRHHPTRFQLRVAGAVGALSRCGPWRRAVQLGSLPFTTTLRPPEVEEALWKILPELRERMPDRPFIVRSILDGRFPKPLPGDGVVLPTWVDYRWDFSDGRTPRTKNFKTDHNHFKKCGLVPVDDSGFDASRVVEALDLYESVYRQRHSLRNPAYTPEFMAMARTRGWLRLRGLADPDSGKLLAFTDVSDVGGASAPSLMGYDVSSGRESRLYRHVFAMVAEIALERRLALNLTSGAGEFKRLRGYLPSLEQSLVFPALAGPRRWSDRAILALTSRMTRDLTVERLIAAGG